MKKTCLLVPLLAIGATACGTDPTSATVHLDARGGWNGTAEVLVHTAAGDLVSRGPLAGDTDVAVDDGDMVTIAITTGTARQLETVFGVQRGDTIYARATPPWPDGYQDVQVHVPTVASAAGWFLAYSDGSSYDSGAGDPTIQVLPGTTSTPILAGALDANQATLAIYGAADAPISGDAIDLSGQAPLDLSTGHVTVTGAPAGAMVQTGTEVWVGDQALSVPVLAADGSVSAPRGVGDRTTVEVSATTATEGLSVLETVADVDGASLDVDLSAIAAPTLGSPTFDGSTLTWTPSGGGTFAGYFASLDYADGTSWVMFAPADAGGTLTPPALPANLAPTGAPQSGWLAAHTYAGIVGGPHAPGIGDRSEVRSADVTIQGATAAPPAIRQARIGRALRSFVAGRR